MALWGSLAGPDPSIREKIPHFSEENRTAQPLPAWSCLLPLGILIFHRKEAGLPPQIHCLPKFCRKKESCLCLRPDLRLRRLPTSTTRGCETLAGVSSFWASVFSPKRRDTQAKAQIGFSRRGGEGSVPGRKNWGVEAFSVVGA